MSDGKTGKNLAELRSEIRRRDDELLTLVAERLALAREVGALKHAASLPIKDYRVEKEVVASARARAEGLGLEPELAEKLTRLLIEYSVQAQDELHQKKKRARPTAAKRVLIAGGRGRMGLWLTEFFESFGHEVTHFDTAVKVGGGATPVAANALITDWVAATEGQDVIALATPISHTARLLEDLTARGSKALIFDICSLKTPIEPALLEAARHGLKVTSTHPMFGPSARLLAGRNILVLTVAQTPNAIAAATAAREIFAETTANVIDLPLARHDELMGFVLGLSHLTSLVFAEALTTSGAAFADLVRVASTTFNAQLDVTRTVTSEHQDLYYEIQAENAHTASVLKALESSLKAYSRAVSAHDKTAFRALMERGRRFLHAD